MNKKIFVFLLLLIYSYSYNNPYFYILKPDGIKECYSDECSDYTVFKKSKLINPFCKKVFVLSGKKIYNSQNYIIKNNSFFDPNSKTYFSKDDGYIVYCVDKNMVILFLIFSILFFLTIFLSFKCLHFFRYLREHNKIIFLLVVVWCIYLFFSFYFFGNVVLFYFDNIPSLIFFVLISFLLVAFSISKAIKIYFDRFFLFEIFMLFVILEILSISIFDQTILIIVFIFLFFFSDQIHKLKLLLFGSKLKKYEKEEEIKKKFSKYCKINNVYVIEADSPNVFTTGIIKKDIYLTSSLVKCLDDKEILALIAHEVGHHYYKHLLKLFAVIFGLYITILFLPVSENIKNILYFLYVVFLIFGIKRIILIFENQADEFAAKVTDKKDLVSAIIKVSKLNRNKFKLKSFLHPSYVDRIDRIIGRQ